MRPEARKALGQLRGAREARREAVRTAPKCRACGKPLRIARRSRGSVWWGYGGRVEDAATYAQALELVPEGARITRGSAKPGASRGTIRYVEADHAWGDYADGAFCGLRCGHAWAVAVLEKIDQGELALVRPGRPAQGVDPNQQQRGKHR